MTEISLRDTVGCGYKEFWNFKGRYRVVKGGRASKKSSTAALWYIYNMMYYYNRYKVKPNLLVVRRYDKTNRNSTFAQLEWAIHRLGVSHLWTKTMSPLTWIYRPSNQQILFRGLNDPYSVTSITVAEGDLCWAWWEEAFQVTNEKAFDDVDMSIRGELPEPLFKQHTLILNPWSDKHWIKRRFFDEHDENTLALTRNYDCNEFLDDHDRSLFEDMKIRRPRRYLIEGRGEWGISEGLVYEDWEIRDFDFGKLIRESRHRRTLKICFGLDFGFTNDPTAFVALAADLESRELYIGYEIYEKRMLNSDIYRAIKDLGFDREIIVADSAEPKSIEELRREGLSGIKGVKKDTVTSGIQVLKEFKIYVHPRCPNAVVELSNYVWVSDKMTGRLTNTPSDDFNHLMDAMRYATRDIGGKDLLYGGRR